MGNRINDNSFYDSVKIEYQDFESAEKMYNAIKECCEKVERYHDIHVIQIMNDVQLIGSSIKLFEIVECLTKGELL